MTLRYSLRELVEMAIQIEIGGENFYRYAAEKNEKLRDVFVFLADEEKRHAAIFQSLLDQQQTGLNIDVSEATPYIRAIIDSGVLRYLSKRKEFPEKMGSVSEALDFALGLEKETILFYYHLLERIGEKRKVTVEKVIGEEKKHVEKIMNLKLSIS